MPAEERVEALRSAFGLALSISNWGVVPLYPLIPEVLIGTYFGGSLALVLPEATLRVIFAAVLTWTGIRPEVMGGKPCIRGMRVTVGMIVGMIAAGHSREDILKLYPYLEVPDIDEALSYAAWRSEEAEVPFCAA